MNIFGGIGAISVNRIGLVVLVFAGLKSAARRGTTNRVAQAQPPMPRKVLEVAACDGCPLQRLFPDNNFVAPAINPGSRLVIAEAPSELEAELGSPLVGPTGAWLRGRQDETGAWKGGLFGRAGIRDTEVSRLNCLQCKPPENVFPTDPDARSYISLDDGQQAVAHCFDKHVLPVLRGRPWKRIDLLGDKALRIVGQKEGGIHRWRGSPINVPALGEALVAVPTLHPAGLAREQRFIPAVVSDLKKSLTQPPEFYVTHPSLDDVRAFTATTFAFDIETNMETGEIICVGLSAKPFSAICVPFKGAYLGELKRIFNAGTTLIGHNCLQFDLPRLREQACRAKDVDAQIWDTMLMQHLLQPDLPHDLGFCGSVLTNKPAWKHLSGDDLESYCCRDVDVTLQCWQQLRPLLRQEQLEKLYSLVQVPLSLICLRMHQQGVSIDNGRIGVVRDALKKDTDDAEQALPEILRTRNVATRKRVLAEPGTLSVKTGKPIKYIMVDATKTLVPWRSPETIATYLYETLKLPPQLHVKSQRVTTDKSAMEKLQRKLTRDGQPEALVIGALRKLRALDELETTFCKEELLKVERVFPHFNVHGTSSGRLSSSDPNLQNIPPAARFIYVPSHPDWRLIEVDYSSIENRLTAWLANDTDRLARLAQPGFNEHRWTASQFFNIPYDAVERNSSKDAPYGKAKRIGHGMNYGMGPRKICNLYDMDFKEVSALCLRWKSVNARTVVWQEATAAQAKREGFLVTPFGRKRWFYSDGYYSESLSFLPQSTAADIIFRAMIALIYEEIDWPFEKVLQVVRVSKPIPRLSRLLLQVHDSLLFEAAPEAYDDLVDTLKLVMPQRWPELGGLAIPIEIKSAPAGASWGELKPL